MFRKIIEKWKRQWLIENESKLAMEYMARLDLAKQSMQKEIDEAISLLESKKLKAKLLEEEVDIRIQTLDARKLELIQVDNELRNQIRVLEAKASPSSVWAEAFSLGMSKSWDLILPVIVGNLDKLKSKIYEDATMDTLKRLNGATTKK